MTLGLAASLSFATACGDDDDDDDGDGTAEADDDAADSADDDDQASAEPILIASLNPLGSGQGGQDFLEGMQVAAAAINQAGGINGRQIEIESYDTEGNPEVATAVYREAGNTDALAAFQGATGGQAIRAISDEIQLPVITAGGIDETFKPAVDYVFGNAPTGELSTIALDYASDELGATTVALLHFDSEFSQGIEGALEARAQEIGMEVVAVEAASVADADVSAQLTNLAASDPDVFYIEGLSPVGIQGFRTLGLDAPVIAEQWLSIPGLAQACGEACEGVVFAAHKCRITEQLPDDDPLKAVCEEYASRYSAMFPDKEVPLFGIYGYDAVNTIAAAVQKVLDSGDDLTRESVAAAIETFAGDLFTTQGEIHTSEDNHALLGPVTESFALVTIVDGGAGWECVYETCSGTVD
ncbi:MAG: ABC transporter substrate-binding protein [Dehalococcoidia bacterium]